MRLPYLNLRVIRSAQVLSNHRTIGSGAEEGSLFVHSTMTVGTTEREEGLRFREVYIEFGESGKHDAEHTVRGKTTLTLSPLHAFHSNHGMNTLQRNFFFFLAVSTGRFLVDEKNRAIT